jgi:diketogulonate reductase-like aldo/keto reductase
MRSQWAFCFLVLAARCAQGQNLFQRMVGKLSGGDKDDIPKASLSNGVKIPLVGIGVGSMVPEVIPAIVAHALRDDKKIRLVDTSSVSQNEHVVAKGIVDGADYLAKSGTQKLEVHVITKVWYTHLGYERTMAAVQETVNNLKPALEHPNVDLKLHVLIHWPRCYDTIPWMHCEEEENLLPESIKSLTPPPHTDKVNAWKGSWKALETLYKDSSSPVSSIGVSNFHVKELEELTKIASVKPHIIEANIWSFLYDPLLVNFAHRHNIHLVAFQVISGVLGNPRRTPFAYHHLLSVCNELSKNMEAKGLLAVNQEIQAAQGLLAWLIQHSVTVIPRTTDLQHLKENSAVALGKIPPLSEQQAETVAYAVEALISGDDMEDDAAVRVTFHAKTKDLHLWWRDDEDDVEIMIATIKKGGKFDEKTHPGHKFKLYDHQEKEQASSVEVYEVSGKYGDHHHVEL